MHRLQEVIRLHRLGKSARRIARHLSMGRNTIGEYLDVLSRAGLLDGPVDSLPELVEGGTLRAQTHRAPLRSQGIDPCPSPMNSSPS